MLPPGASLVGPFSLPIVVCFTYKHTCNQLPAPPALLDWLAARVCPFWLQSDVSFGEGTAYLFRPSFLLSSLQTSDSGSALPFFALPTVYSARPISLHYFY
jgi:hypothetical protein